MNNFDSAQIPPYITALVAELDQWIAAATVSGVNDADGERYRSHQDEMRVQLRALGWDATLADSGHWAPILSGYSIIHNPPDPHYYPQRCYHVAEGPPQWCDLWDGDRKVCFVQWSDAYAYVFSHRAQEQAQLPLMRYRVRPPNTLGGTDYAATSAEQALQLHMNYWIALGWVTVSQVVALSLHVFEHSSGRDGAFFCRACQHAPCKFTPAENWSIPTEPCWIGNSL